MIIYGLTLLQIQKFRHATFASAAPNNRAHKRNIFEFFIPLGISSHVLCMSIFEMFFFFLTRCTNVQRLARVETVPLFAISGTVVRKFDKLSPAERGRTQYTRHVLHTLSTDRTTYLNKNFHRIDWHYMCEEYRGKTGAFFQKVKQRSRRRRGGKS